MWGFYFSNEIPILVFVFYVGIIAVHIYRALSDDQLILLLKENNQLALSELYLRYWDKLFAVACKKLADPAEAEEIVQDIFVSLWERRKQLELRYQLCTYLAVAVKYRVINIMDKHYRERSREEAGSLEVAYLSPAADEYVLEKELVDRIEASISALPEKCRIVFRLSREEGLTNKQIAARMDVTESTVEKHMTKALKDIRSNLGITLPALLLLVAATNKL